MLNLLAATQPVTDAAIGEAVLNALIVVLVVFAALCALSLVIWLFGLVGKKQDTTKKVPSVAAPTPACAPVAAASSEEEEVIAAIGAAVAMMQPEGVQFAVKKITPVTKKMDMAIRSEWAAAAIRQNTMPF